MFLSNSTIILVIPAFIFAIWAQFKVKRTYAKYSEIGTRRGLTGAGVAERIMGDAGIVVTDSPEAYPGGQACALGVTPGVLTDHYDPRHRVLRLSEGVFYGRSVAALGVAAHEAGHAIQHARMYSPLMLRNVVYPLCSIGSTLAWPLFLIGLFIRTGMSPLLMNAGILLFSFAVFFTVLTLPVEFNASRRALRVLAEGGYLDDEELAGARRVLAAAALTYVAAAAMAALQLLRMILIRGRD